MFSLVRLSEGPLLPVSFDGKGMYAALSFDEGDTWSARKRIDQGRRGYLAATQAPDHLITSEQ